MQSDNKSAQERLEPCVQMETSPVLVVDGDTEAGEKTRAALESTGYAVLLCGTIGQARECVAAAPPRAILLTDALPDGCGLAFCRELRTLHQYKRPIFLQSTLDTKADIIAGYESGCLDYLVKPVDLTILSLKLRGYLAVWES